MLVDGISREQMVDLVLQALLNAGTVAGDRVYAGRDWPTSPYQFPMILIQAPRERKVSLYPGLLEFNTTISVAVVGRAVGLLPDPVKRDAETLVEQITSALFLFPPLYHAVQQFAVVETQIVFTAEAKQHIGEVVMTFEMVVYQAYGADGPPLTNITAELTVEGGTPGGEPPISVQIMPSTP